MRPKWATARSATFCSCARLETSAGTATASPPLSRICSATSASVRSLRAVRTTRAPCDAADRAVASPIPLEAPVMTMTCLAMGLRSVGMRASFLRAEVRVPTMRAPEVDVLHVEAEAPDRVIVGQAGRRLIFAALEAPERRLRSSIELAGLGHTLALGR